jgi:peroxiredoxin
MLKLLLNALSKGSALIGTSIECTTGNFIEALMRLSCLRISLAKAQFLSRPILKYKGSTMISTQTPICDFNTPAIDFNLKGVDGKIHNLASCKGKNGLLVMFICNHCPYVKAIIERIIKDTKELKALGLNAVAIMSNNPKEYEADSFENMQKIAKEMDFSFPYLMDKTQEVAKAYGAVCTPDFFGYNTNLALQYRGRLDASRKETALSSVKRDLFDAMIQVATTGQGPTKQIPSMGCSIKWK